MNTRKFHSALSLTCMVLLSASMVACGPGEQYLDKLNSLNESPSTVSETDTSNLANETPTVDTAGEANEVPDLGAAAGDVTTVVTGSEEEAPSSIIIINPVIPGIVTTPPASTDSANIEIETAAEPEPAVEPLPAPLPAPEPAPESAPESAPEPVAKGEAVFNGDLGTNEILGAAECINITNTSKGFGQVTATDWRSWLNNYTYSVRPEYLDTGLDGERAYFRQKLIPTSIGSHHVQAGGNLSASRTYRITQSLYFEPGFDWGGKNEGGKVGFGFGGGSSPSGGVLQTDGFTLRLMWRGNKDGTAKIVAYSYAADRGQHLPYGDDYPLEGFEIPVGEWFDITLEVKTNSSTSARDGSLRGWANGQLRLQRDNIGWQTSGDQPTVQKLVFTTFYGGNDTSWSPSQTTYIRFADACWAAVLSNSQQNDPAQGPEEPAVSLDDTVQTPRGRIIQSVSDIEVLLPTDTSETNGTIYNALDAINRSLSTDQWLDNDTIKLSSWTISDIRSAVTELSEVSSNGDESEHVREESDQNSYSLVYAAYTLTEKSRLQVEDKLKLHGCTIYEKTSYCSNSYLHLDQADEWLRQSNQDGLSYQEQMNLISLAWLDVKRASGSL